MFDDYKHSATTISIDTCKILCMFRTHLNRIRFFLSRPPLHITSPVVEILFAALSICFVLFPPEGIRTTLLFNLYLFVSPVTDW